MSDSHYTWNLCVVGRSRSVRWDARSMCMESRSWRWGWGVSLEVKLSVRKWARWQSSKKIEITDVCIAMEFWDWN